MSASPAWQEAERASALHMRTLGFEDAVVTVAGPDGGVDVVASGAVAQVKHFADTPVGAPAVRQLRGAAHAGGWAIFYAASGYSAAAVAFADSSSVALFSYDLDWTITPVNIHARSLVHAAPSQSGQAASAADYLKAEQAVEAALMAALARVSTITATASRAMREGRLKGRSATRVAHELNGVVQSLSTVTETTAPAWKHMATIKAAQRRLNGVARRAR